MTRFKDFLLFGCVALLGVVVGLLISGALRLAGSGGDGRAVEAGPVVAQVSSGDGAARGAITTSYHSVVNSAAGSVVYIFTTTRVMERMPGFTLRRFGGRREREEEGLGSGVIMSSEGYILTNHHVIEGADEIQVITSHTGEAYAAQLVGADPETDIAVLKIAARGLPAISAADSDLVKVGDVALAIGNPFGVGLSVTMGIVGAVGRGGFGINDYEDFIQTDASINPGNSGGALVNTDGELIGVNTAILSRSGGNQGVGFSVPSNQAMHIMKRIIEDGRVVRGFLGVQVETLTPTEARRIDFPFSGGAIIADVERGAPAAQAGLQRGDVVVQINGTAVREDRQLRLLISRNKPQSMVALKIVRNGSLMSLNVSLGELPGYASAGAALPEPARPAANPFDGVQIAELDSYARRQFRISSRVYGALVAEVDENSRAHAAGLRQGGVIVGINNMPVRSAREAALFSRFIEDSEVTLRVYYRRKTGTIRIQAE